MKSAFFTLVVCFCIGGLHADVVFATGNHPQPGETNILLSSGMTGTTVTGTPNGFPAFTVNFTSTQTLLEPSSGQARVSGSPDGTPLTNMSISLVSGSYGDLIINPFSGGCSACVPGTATVTVDAINSLGVPETPAVFTYALAGSGNNFLTITTTMSEKIVTTSIVDSGSFGDLRQPRISGLSTLTVIPEPSTYAPLIGLALTSIVLIRRFRKA